MARFRRLARAAAVAVTACTLATGVAGHATAQPSSPTPDLSSGPAPDPCADTIMLEVAPTNFSIPQLPPTLDPPGMVKFANDLRARGVHVEAVPYNAMWLTGQISYNDSRDDGIARTEARMADLAATCPTSTVGLVGYSSGADIAAHIAGKIGRGEGVIPAERLGAVIAMANPSRSTVGTVMAGTAGPGEGFLPPMNYGSVAGNVFELCDTPDTSCNMSNIAPGMRRAVVDPVVDNAFLTPGGAAAAASGLSSGLTSPAGGNTLANLGSALLGIPYHATAYWVNPASPLYTQGIDFVLTH